MFVYFLLLVKSLSKVDGSIAVVDKGLFPLEGHSVAIQLFADIENMNRDKACRVYPLTKRCCLTTRPSECDHVNIFCPNELVIEPKDRKTLVCIYPTVFHHDKTGFCEFSLNYKYPHKLLKRYNLNITFDTRIPKLEKENLRKYIGERKFTRCASVDQDSLRECSPVDCSLKYTDEKPYYDTNLSRCVKAATCLGDPTKTLADMAYLPDVNLCRDLRYPVEIQDIYAISNGLSIVTETPREDKLVANLNTNCSTISQNMAFLWDLMTGKLCPTQKGVSIDYSTPCKVALLSILSYIIGLAALIASCVCCVYTLTRFHRNWACGNLRDCCDSLRRKLSRGERGGTHNQYPRTSNVRNSLLRDVINRDIPLELRHSVIDVCDRLGREVRWKKKYRYADVDRPLQSKESSDSSTSLLRASDEPDQGSCSK